jgi:hypothetical protein
VPAQITQRGDVSLSAAEEMLVNAEHARANGAAPLRLPPHQEIDEPTLHRGAADPLSLPQPAAADPIEMLQINASAERLGGALVRQNSGKTLPESAPAFKALPLVRFQLQYGLAGAPAFMPWLAQPSGFQAQADAAAMWAGSRPAMPRRDLYLSRFFLNACNLVSRQT